MRRWISCWAKPGQLRRPGATGGHQPEDHGDGEQDQGDDPTGPGGVPQVGGVHDCSSSGQPPSEKTLAVVAQQPNGLAERAQALEAWSPQTTAAVDRALASTQLAPTADTKRQYGLELQPGGWVDDVMHLRRSPSARSEPRCSNWPARPAGWPRPGRHRQHPSPSPPRCRWPIPRVAAPRQPQHRPRC